MFFYLGDMCFPRCTARSILDQSSGPDTVGTSVEFARRLGWLASQLPYRKPPMHYKTIVLNSRPLTDIEPDTFRTETHPRSELKPDKGEALVQCTWLSLDPAMRGFIRDARSYLPPVKIGEVCQCFFRGPQWARLILLQVMRAAGLGVVVEVGPGSTFEVGDHVTGSWGAFFLFLSPIILMCQWISFVF